MQRLNRAQILALIPHDGAMCLLDSVVDWDDACIHCRSDTLHQAHAHPLRHAGGVAAVHLIEYGAQAAAVHGGLLASQSEERPRSGGVLASLRDVVLSEKRVDAIGAPLDIHAYREMGGVQGMVYRFVVESAGTLRSSGRLTIMGFT